MPSSHRTLASALVALLLATPAFAQNTPPAERVIRMSGTVTGAPGQQATVRFAIYDAESGGTLLWQETQAVALDQTGQYTAFLGAMSAEGVPPALFANGAPRWLAVEGPDGALGPRTLLAAVPYAVAAATATNATTLAGRPASDFQLTPAARRKDAANGLDAPGQLDAPAVNNGTANYIGKFFNNVDLINSSLYDTGGLVGLNTTTPLDVFHSRFTNAGGTQTGIAVQNLSSAAGAYSGMLFYDHTGALRQFQGYNNSTGEYRINNIATSPSINFMTGSTSRFLIDSFGNVGIGQTSPSYKLDILHSGSTGIRVQSSSGFSVVDIDASSGDAALRFANNGVNQWNIRNRPSDNYLEIFELGGGGTRMLIQDGTGFVGIGGSAPTVPLEVFPTVGGIATTGAFSFFNPSSTTLGTGTNNTFSTVSIRAAGQILANIFAAVSDERIKDIKGRSAGVADLTTLRDIEITDYTYKDTVTRGNQNHKKVIAQQVERVFPQAVSRTTDVIPDIFKKADMVSGWIALPTNLTVGERVRLVTENGHQAVHTVTAVEANRFQTDFAGDGSQLFVYGREVKDFRVVDYEAISMLNVSATQELARRLEQQTAETANLKDQVAQLRAALATALEAMNAAKNR
jgi:hypothetical protein